VAVLPEFAPAHGLQTMTNLPKLPSFSADGVVIATGGVPRRLPAADGLLGVHALRIVEHADVLRAELTDGAEHVAPVTGASFIGAEVAATCRSLGRKAAIVVSPSTVARGTSTSTCGSSATSTRGIVIDAAHDVEKIALGVGGHR
jgi:NADPH-dependent 2,4-dienoyl-CoA reductase/sulfur reductase-like enzyme